MTEFTIRYHKYNQELGECEIKVPNDTVSDLIQHFRVFFEIGVVCPLRGKGKVQ